MSRLPDPAPGALSFRFMAEIAVGATARVDLCRAESGERAGQLLAVKRLHPHIAEDQALADQFLDEVWMTVALKHPNVVEVAGWGTDAQGAFLAVELVQGVSLARLMKTVFETGEVFSERMVVYIMSRVCRGLATAHALRGPDGQLLSLVHRDLTPGNVLIGFNGDVKIADFGLAKAKQRLTKTLTGLLKGQPAYMAPEQARGFEIDRRADIFAVGVVLFELFAGRRPWSATSEFETVQVTASSPPADLRELRPKIDRELVGIVMRCLEKDPASRFQSAEEVGHRLETWLEAHGYVDGNSDSLARFVRRNSMRQMRWFERAIAGELAAGAESLRPSQTRPTPPVLYAQPSSTGARADANAPETRRARVRPRPPPRDSDTTEVTREVTHAELKIAALHAQVSSDSPPSPPAPTGPPVAEGRSALRDPLKVTQLSAQLELSQSSDNADFGEEIPTLVKRPVITGLAGTSPGETIRARVKPRAQGRAPFALQDDDSDGPTTDVQQKTGKMPLVRAPAVAVTGLPTLADNESEEIPTVPLKAKVDAPRLRTTLVAHATRGATPPPSAPPAPAAPTTPMPPGGPPPMGQQRYSSDRPLSEDVLLSEADRFALEAVRLNEEAKVAAAVAASRSSIAKIAGDAAMIAAEAVRIATTHGLVSAARRLEDARMLEIALQRSDLTPASIEALSAQAAAALADRSAALVPHLTGAPGQGAGGHSGIMNVPSSVTLAVQDPGTYRGDTFASGRPSGFEATSFDAFRVKLQPTLLGLPLTIVLAISAIALAGIALLVWFLVPQ